MSEQGPPGSGGPPGGDEASRLQRLEERVARLERHLGELTARPATPPPAAAAPARPPAPRPPVAAPPKGPKWSLPPGILRPRDWAPGATPPPRPARPRSDRDLEAAIGQIWVSRAGLAVLLFALVLFLKWAYDRNLISHEVRTALGVLAGLALITVGEVVHRRAARYAEAFTGAGIVALYATFFAAYQLYGLFDQVQAFAFMAATTAAAVVFAVRHDAAAIAAIGILGGFSVPYLLPGPGARLEPVLVYFLILEAGLLAAVPRLKRHREPLLVLAVLAAFAGPAPATFGAEVSFPFWLGYFLLLGAGIAWLLPRRRYLPEGVVQPLLGVLSVFPFLVPAIFARGARHPALAAGYLTIAYLGFLFVVRRSGGGLRLVPSLATGSVLLALASAGRAGADAWWTVAACGLVAAAAVALTARRARAPSYAALFLGGPVGLSYLARVPEASLVVEAIFPSAMLAVFVAALLLRESPDNRDVPMLLASPAMFGAALWVLLEDHSLDGLHGMLMLSLAVVYAGTAALAGRLRPASPFLRLTIAGIGVVFLTLVFPAQFDRATVTIAWAVEGAVLTYVGLRLARRSIRVGGAVVLLLGVGRFLILDAHLISGAPDGWAAFANPRTLAAAWLVAAAFTVAALLARALRAGRLRPGREPKLLLGGSFVLGNLVLLTGISLDVHLVFRGAGGEGATEQFVLTAYYALHSIVLITVGLLRSARGARLLGLLLFAGTLAKAAVIDLKFLDTIDRVFSFLALGGLLVAASWLYQRYRARLGPPGDGG